MLKRVGGVTIAIQYHVPLTFITNVIQTLKTAHVKKSGWGNHCHTIPCTVNIRHKMSFVANRLTGNLPVNGIG